MHHVENVGGTSDIHRSVSLSMTEGIIICTMDEDLVKDCLASVMRKG